MTPKQWIDTRVELVCLKCGQAIGYYTGSWEYCEERADVLLYRRAHTCEVSIQVARAAMKQYRATHPPMTFEEEVELYKSLINPT